MSGTHTPIDTIDGAGSCGGTVVLVVVVLVDVDVEVEGSTVVVGVTVVVVVSGTVDVVVVSGTVDDVAVGTVVGTAVVGTGVAGGVVGGGEPDVAGVVGRVGGVVGRVVGVGGRVVGGASVVLVVDVVVVVVVGGGLTSWSGPVSLGTGQPGGAVVVVVSRVVGVTGTTTAADVDGGAVVDVVELDVVVLLVDVDVDELVLVDVATVVSTPGSTGTTTIGTVVGDPMSCSGPPDDPPPTTKYVSAAAATTPAVVAVAITAPPGVRSLRITRPTKPGALVGAAAGAIAIAAALTPAATRARNAAGGVNVLAAANRLKTFGAWTPSWTDAPRPAGAPRPATAPLSMFATCASNEAGSIGVPLSLTGAPSFRAGISHRPTRWCTCERSAPY